jgi:hypothetical protein
MTTKEKEAIKKLANKLTKTEYKIAILGLENDKWSVKLPYQLVLVFKKERFTEKICRRIIKEPYIDHDELKISIDGVISVAYNVYDCVKKDLEKKEASIDLNPCRIWAPTTNDLLES